MVLPVNDTPADHSRLLPEEQYDGPYVRYQTDKIFVKYILLTNGTTVVKTDTVQLQQKDNLVLNVMTDQAGKLFQVKLMKEFQNENSETPKVNKMVVLSDIEGNFTAFRKLLQASKVIDEDLNWTFGDGHLVLIGDFFDRGLHVTEVLWLIYNLEQKAKAAGGYVHFVLGNHEIMNLSGDLRYLNPKYNANSALLNQRYVSLYDENSELGRWLRTKNVVEKIGDILFLHGGISPTVNRFKIPIAEINKLARPYYGDSTFKYDDPRSDSIYNDNGPFWYRGYYQRVPPDVTNQIDATLSQFNINHIITGHTIVADTISVWYNGRLLDTDVHHAASKSEALLIENDKFYRVNQNGDKVFLMEGKTQKK
jgi:hypothetical protein